MVRNRIEVVPSQLEHYKYTLNGKIVEKLNFWLQISCMGQFVTSKISSTGTRMPRDFCDALGGFNHYDFLVP